jgi:hypothetical protein
MRAAHQGAYGRGVELLLVGELARRGTGAHG